MPVSVKLPLVAPSVVVPSPSGAHDLCLLRPPFCWNRLMRLVTAHTSSANVTSPDALIAALGAVSRRTTKAVLGAMMTRSS
jgi:hypothetical protein